MVLALFLLVGVTSSVLAQAVANPGFETGNFTSWVTDANATISATNAHTGNFCVAISGGGTALQSITGLTPNTTYTLVGWGKQGTPCIGWIGVKNFGGTQIYTTISGSSYQQVVINFTTGATNTSAQIWISQGNGQTGVLYGDDFSIGFKPATDPANTGNWTANPAFSDEFNGTTLDTTKWYMPTSLGGWAGFSPAMWDPANHSVSGGVLHLQTINQDLLTNGSFETGDLSGWTNPAGGATISTLAKDAAGIQQAAQYTYGCMITGNADIEQVVTGLTPNTTYQLGCNMRIGTGTQVTMGVKNYGGTTKTLAKTVTDWYPTTSLQFTTGATSTSATIFASNSGGTGTVYCDEFSVVPATLPSGMHLTPGYYISASSVASLATPVYGYYEARIKASNTPVVSAFWFVDVTVPQEEIDVCELIGNATHNTSNTSGLLSQEMPMDTWYKDTYKNQAYFNLGVPVAADFHIYAVDWEPTTITYYCDGAPVPVRQINQLIPPAFPTMNGQTLVTRLQHLMFDSEVFAGYGIPPKGTATEFQVDYVRAWTH